MKPKHDRTEDISPAHHVNAYLPEHGDYRRLAHDEFREWRLRVIGLIDEPLELWGGVRVTDILRLCRPRPDARWIVFHASVQEEYAPDYYEAFTLKEMDDPQTILAYEMNGYPLTYEHGAPVACVLRQRSGTRW